MELLYLCNNYLLAFICSLSLFFFLILFALLFNLILFPVRYDLVAMFTRRGIQSEKINTLSFSFKLQKEAN